MTIACHFRRAILASLFATGILTAEVVHVRDYRSHEPRDRRVLFKFVVTPDQDLLSFVPRADGKWRLTRIEGWAGDKPVEHTITIPGWTVTRGPANTTGSMSGLWQDLLVSSDGRYAVCGAAGDWVGRAPDELVSVVDLHTFAVVKTLHTALLRCAGLESIHKR